ncbi:MAG TPA: YidC/Oxa1 family membrane protein insertase [Dictyobacter sp.]|nr:YidC/Oxa1 family membrane protein insertase [Dictyobacter sp.]
MSAFGAIGNLFNTIFTFPIFNALVVLYHLFGDFGLAIVVLTLIIKLILFPLTLQQLKSMKATQSLQPQMQEIRRKYAKDQQAQAMAMQALYKEYGVNPLAGCLPMVIQLPVLYGLFYALESVFKVNTHNLNAALITINSHIYPFVPKFAAFPSATFTWFSWLTFLNPILHTNLSFTFPLNAADPSHILPILAGLATFVQLRMSQARNAAMTGSNGKAAPADPTQQSMKMMQYVMPFVTVFIGWSFPAGLALYWTVSSVFQAVQQYFVTGWGALSFSTNSTSSSTSKSQSRSSTPNVVESTISEKSSNRKKGNDVVVDADEGDEEAAQATKQTSTAASAKSGSDTTASPYSRRQRNGSASARRRSGTQRSRR